MLGRLLRDTQEYNGAFITRCALRLAPMMFQRPGQVRFADWKDISLDIKLWRCLPEKMKMSERQKRDTPSSPRGCSRTTVAEFTQIVLDDGTAR